MKKFGVVLLMFAVLGCAKLNVETKEPIKVDINMRIDVYQHVAKDAESINDQIYGNNEKKINFLFNFSQAYAASVDDLEAAIERRKARAGQIEENFNQGYIGENRKALLEVRSKAAAGIESLVNSENADRQIIYQYTAEKNGVDVSETQKVFFQDDYERASSGWWLEVSPGTWKQK
ncbi:MAG: YdbL family protein [Candidatus Omnitrophica bacterium]|nr:YdbL family protein [Candidatus Omnitrophota bacterium]MBU2044513.1 YdbL family protein [Candidatus Omnitrophota bacterium]MBU2266017.1 YdbL family protein [Candidatus Omnitrophota bacterium]MBU2473404.1 YdbL family protein [Candidatus Omnitrophota bacterium]